MKNWGLTFGGGKEGLEGYTDADGASQEHRGAISGYMFIIDGSTISWTSCKQELITLSTTEAEYVVSTHAAKEAIWLRNFIGEVFSPLVKPTTLHCENQSMLAIATNGNFMPVQSTLTSSITSSILSSKMALSSSFTAQQTT